MKLWTLMLVTLLALALVIYFAIAFAPPESQVYTSPEQARAYIKECKEKGGNPTVAQVMTDYGLEYHMECDVSE
jgi:hypothetical protein